MILIGYKKCTTCKGIEKMLDEKNIKYTYREIYRIRKKRHRKNSDEPGKKSRQKN